jgi:hypothetical protein
MAMFARRSLQRLLDDLEGKLSPEARQKLVQELNRQNTSALGYEWELALLFALSRVGHVTYESESHAGSRRPDITFVEKQGGSIRFVADVATISDAGIDGENPVMRFSQSLHRLKMKCGLPGVLNYDIKGDSAGRSERDRKMKLKLPRLADLDKFLETHVGPEFRRISEEKRTTATITINQPGVEFSVTYVEGQRYGSGHHPSYTAAYSTTRNPVYTTLKAKARQLKGSGATDAFGIFLCDGGCTLLSRTGRQPQQVSVDEVIAEFFRQNSSVSFVVILLFPPTRAQPFTGIVKELKITGRIYTNPRSTNALSAETLLNLINRGLSALPQPVATPRDALYWIARSEGNVGQTIGGITHGGGLMSETIKMSARKIHELLAGRMTARELFSEYERPSSPFQNPFERALRQGLTMDAITLTKTLDGDDDLLEIRFGIADPAISKLKASN